MLVLSTFANGQTSRITDELVVSGEALQGQAIATLPFPVTTLDTDTDIITVTTMVIITVTTMATALVMQRPIETTVIGVSINNKEA